MEIAESKTLKTLVQEKETATVDLQKELTIMRFLNEGYEMFLGQKI